MNSFLTKMVIFKDSNIFNKNKVNVLFYFIFVLLAGNLIFQIESNKTDPRSLLIFKSLAISILLVEMLNYFFFFRLKLLKIEISKNKSRNIWMLASLLYYLPTKIFFILLSNKFLIFLIIIFSWVIYLININAILQSLYQDKIREKHTLYLLIFFILPSMPMFFIALLPLIN